MKYRALVLAAARNRQHLASHTRTLWCDKDTNTGLCLAKCRAVDIAISSTLIDHHHLRRKGAYFVCFVFFLSHIFFCRCCFPRFDRNCEMQSPGQSPGRQVAGCCDNRDHDRILEDRDERPNVVNSCANQGGLSLQLEDRELWTRFQSITNEMIVTKNGR